MITESHIVLDPCVMSLWQKVWQEQLKEGKIDCGSWIQGSQCVLRKEWRTGSPCSGWTRKERVRQQAARDNTYLRSLSVTRWLELCGCFWGLESAPFVNGSGAVPCSSCCFGSMRKPESRFVVPMTLIPLQGCFGYSELPCFPTNFRMFFQGLRRMLLEF